MSHGYLPFTTAWYRKHITIPDTARGAAAVSTRISCNDSEQYQTVPSLLQLVAVLRHCTVAASWSVTSRSLHDGAFNIV